MSRDPLASLTLSPYAYSESDPVNELDPDGEFSSRNPFANTAFGPGIHGWGQLGNKVVNQYVFSPLENAASGIQSDVSTTNDHTAVLTVHASGYAETEVAPGQWTSR